MKDIWRELEGNVSVYHSFVVFFSDRHSITLRKILFFSEHLQELSLIRCSHCVSSGAGSKLPSISWSAVTCLPYGTPGSPLIPKSQLSITGSIPSPCPGDVRWRILQGTGGLQAANRCLPAKPPRGSYYCISCRNWLLAPVLIPIPSALLAHCSPWTLEHGNAVHLKEMSHFCSPIFSSWQFLSICVNHWSFFLANSASKRRLRTAHTLRGIIQKSKQDKGLSFFSWLYESLQRITTVQMHFK